MSEYNGMLAPNRQGKKDGISGKADLSTYTD